MLVRSTEESDSARDGHDIPRRFVGLPVKVRKSSKAKKAQPCATQEETQFLREKVTHEMRFVGFRDQALLVELPYAEADRARMAAGIQLSRSGAQDPSFFDRDDFHPLGRSLMKH